MPKWLKPVAVAVAALLPAILIAGIVSVPYRATRPPEGQDQPRIHWNTKNTTRFAGSDPGGVAAILNLALYPGGDAGRPDLVILYSPDNWAAGLQAASLLRPLNAVLLPATDTLAEDVQRLNPRGSAAAGGATVLVLAGVAAESVGGQSLAAADIPALLDAAGASPRHALLVDPADPATALLAAPWAAYSSDLIVFDLAAVPAGLPIYALGNVAGDGVTSVGGTDPARTAVDFATYEDAVNPLFGWGFNASSLSGYRAYTLARASDPGLALLSANLAAHGKPGPLLWSNADRLPPVVNNYLWTQRAAFWVTPAEGPFHHFYVLGGPEQISFAAQSQADYAVEIGPYLGKGVGMSGIDMLAAAWVALGLASAAWVLFHELKYLPHQQWVMRLAWPLMAMLSGPFGILLYYLAYQRPVVRHGEMVMWDRPLWLQGLVATASAVGFGATLMITTGFVATFLGLPLLPNRLPGLFWLGTPMILLMILNYAVAVLVTWLLFQTPMLANFYGQPYRQALPRGLLMVLISMSVAALGMNPSMWWLMMSHIPMMPTEESILWFGVMFFTGFVALLVAWPFNYLMVRARHKPGLM